MIPIPPQHALRRAIRRTMDTSPALPSVGEPQEALPDDMPDLETLDLTQGQGPDARPPRMTHMVPRLSSKVAIHDYPDDLPAFPDERHIPIPNSFGMADDLPNLPNLPDLPNSRGSVPDLPGLLPSGNSYEFDPGPPGLGHRPPNGRRPPNQSPGLPPNSPVQGGAADKGFNPVMQKMLGMFSHPGHPGLPTPAIPPEHQSRQGPHPPQFYHGRGSSRSSRGSRGSDSFSRPNPMLNPRGSPAGSTHSFPSYFMFPDGPRLGPDGRPINPRGSRHRPPGTPDSRRDSGRAPLRAQAPEFAPGRPMTSRSLPTTPGFYNGFHQSNMSWGSDGTAPDIPPSPCQSPINRPRQPPSLGMRVPEHTRAISTGSETLTQNELSLLQGNSWSARGSNNSSFSRQHTNSFSRSVPPSRSAQLQNNSSGNGSRSFTPALYNNSSSSLLSSGQGQGRGSQMSQRGSQMSPRGSRQMSQVAEQALTPRNSDGSVNATFLQIAFGPRSSVPVHINQGALREQLEVALVKPLPSVGGSRPSVLVSKNATNAAPLAPVLALGARVESSSPEKTLNDPIKERLSVAELETHHEILDE